jgi:hypothetical protein
VFAKPLSKKVLFQKPELSPRNPCFPPHKDREHVGPLHRVPALWDVLTGHSFDALRVIARVAFTTSHTKETGGVRQLYVSLRTTGTQAGYIPYVATPRITTSLYVVSTMECYISSCSPDHNATSHHVAMATTLGHCISSCSRGPWIQRCCTRALVSPVPGWSTASPHLTRRPIRTSSGHSLVSLRRFKARVASRPHTREEAR